MCFSAEASLVTGAALLPAGVYCITSALRKNRAYLPLAVLPALFGVQQLFEAAVWIGLQHDRPGLVRPAALGFLFFAIAFWPVWVPVAAAALERRRGRRLFCLVLAGVGAGALAVYVPLAARAGDALRVEIVNHSVRYDLSALPVVTSVSGVVLQVLYLFVVCVPLLLSADRRLRVLGLAVALAAVVTQAAFRYAFASVWCFFAALLSLHVCYVLSRAPRATPGRAGAVPV